MRVISAVLLLSIMLCCCGSLEYASAQGDFAIVDSEAPIASEAQDLIIEEAADSLEVSENFEPTPTMLDFDQPAEFQSEISAEETLTEAYLEGDTSAEQWPADRVAAEALPTTALTQDLNKTISVAGGANWLDGDSGYIISAAIGKRLNDRFRFDVEFAHRSNREDVDLLFLNSVYSRISSKAKVNANSIMANLFLDWNNTTRFTPYLGVGMGISFVHTEEQATGYGDAGEVLVRVQDSDKDSVFTSQVIGGVALRLGTLSDLYVEYRGLATSEVVFKKFGPAGHYNTHNLMLGYRKKF